jgi:hypothetical protein
LAYCTGIRRWLCSTKTTRAMTRKPMRMMPMKTSQRPSRCWMAHSEAGKPAAIEVKMSRDMPLPMPGR